MRGDFSRQTFARAKHYASVLVQQGRVAVDADWNEQQAITGHRTETETVDVIGGCGTPLDPPGYTDASGFKIAIAAGATSITIGAGRYYVEGLLAENEKTIAYGDQDSAPYELPAPPAILSLLATEGEIGLVYLDVWRRHVTALDDPLIREKALGEADTATRARTAWQAKVLPLPGAAPPVMCDGQLGPWSDLVAASTGTLSAVTHHPTTTPDPCEPPPSAGYTRLENQLYRVEVHRGSGGGATPTFKWSRENGSIVTDVRSFDANQWITVGSMGRDEELGFAKDQWVELVNDASELNTDGKVRGQLTTIVDVNPGKNGIRLADAALDTALARHPRLRRWDMVSRPAPEAVTVTTAGIVVQPDVEVPIEDGISVTFSSGTYRDGDYWLIPARTTNGDIEWPRNAGVALPQSPIGVRHHYCRLAFIQAVGGKLVPLTDCRRKFPPLTELTSFFYVGGDGQEVMPDPDPNATTAVPLPEPLQVGVANGGHPVGGATVRFAIVNPSPAGTVDGNPNFVEVPTGADGIASCKWAIASNRLTQQVQATLRVNGAPAHLPIVFSAQRSRADEVRYFPPNGCATLSPTHDVQSAIDRLGELIHLTYVSGDAQEVAPADRANLAPLQVRVASACGQIKGATVEFSLLEGGESVAPTTTTTDGAGLASCDWVLDGTNQRQRALATLIDAGPNAGPQASIHAATSTVEFSARLDLSAPTAKPRVVRIRRIRRGDGKDLDNDADIALAQLLPSGPGVDAPGIVIETDQPINPATVEGKQTLAASDVPNAHPSCFVTIELPWPVSPPDAAFWSGQSPFDLPLGFETIVLSANVRAAGTQIVWFPTANTSKWMFGPMFNVLKGHADRVLTHLTLKGAFIRSEERDFLDGEPFGPRTSVNDNPTSGDGAPGGDFEMWFWLVRG